MNQNLGARILYVHPYDSGGQKVTVLIRVSCRKDVEGYFRLQLSNLKYETSNDCQFSIE